MRDDQLRERLASYAAHGEELARPPEPAMIRRRARRRYGGRVLAVVVVALVTLAGVQAIRINAARELPALRPVPTVSSFVAGDRQGRLVVAASATGKLVRVLAPPRSDQVAGVGPLYHPVVPGDRSAVYYAGACTGTGRWGAIYRQPLDGGRPTRVADGTGTWLTVSEDGSTLAWVDTRCDRPLGHQDRVTVRDLQRGTERHWPIASESAYGLALSPDGRRLAMIWSSGPQSGGLLVLDVGGAGRLRDGRLLRWPDAGCQPGTPVAYRPGWGQLAVVERCGPLYQPSQQLRLVYVDEATGVVRERPLALPAWATDTGVNGLDFDRSGTRLIYGLSRDGSVSTWEYRQGGSVKLGDGYTAPSW
jgi:hypothetical protein